MAKRELPKPEPAPRPAEDQKLKRAILALNKIRIISAYADSSTDLDIYSKEEIVKDFQRIHEEAILALEAIKTEILKSAGAISEDKKGDEDLNRDADENDRIEQNMYSAAEDKADHEAAELERRENREEA